MDVTCLKCAMFDKTKKGAYKCGVAGSCPGKDWPDDAKLEYIKLKVDRDRLHRLVSKKNKEVGRCPSLSPNGRACFLESPHDGCNHESVSLPGDEFEQWSDKESYQEMRKPRLAEIQRYLDEQFKKKES